MAQDASDLNNELNRPETVCNGERVLRSDPRFLSGSGDGNRVCSTCRLAG